jgi:hypothetical protein
LPPRAARTLRGIDEQVAKAVAGLAPVKRQARPIYHRKRDSIEAHLTVVFAALAVSRWIEAQTG